MALTNEQYRAGAIAFINKRTGQKFVDGSLPDDIEIAVDLLMKGMKENQSVASQALGDMSKSFFQNGSYLAAKEYWRSYLKAGFK